MSLSGEPKETAISRQMKPADGSNPAWRNKSTGISARPRLTEGDPQKAGSLSLTNGRGK
jgi:hypothetical protein